MLPSRRTILIFAGVILASLLLVYGASLRNDFVRFDDGLLIYDNPAIRFINLHTLKTIVTTYDPELYIPLTLFVYQILYQIAGTTAFPYHLALLLLHAGNSILAMAFLSLLSRSRSAAWVGALLFALHPLQVEAVAWASALKDQLATMLYLAALLAFLAFRTSSRRSTYVASVLFCLFGLLSKVTVITMPLILVLIDIREGRKWWTWSSLSEKVPFFLLSIVFGIIALYGKTEVLGTSSPLSIVLMGAHSVIFVLQKIFVPYGFSVLYPFTGSTGFDSLKLILSFLAVIAVTITVWLARKQHRDLCFGWLFFLVTIAPTFTNLAKAGELYSASDRYASFPVIGVFFLLGTLWSTFDDRLSHVGGQWLRGCTVVLLTVLGWLSFQQSLVWRDTESLFRNVLRFYPHSYAAHNNLANVHRRRGNLDAAVAELLLALQGADHAKIHGNLGAVYVKKGMFREAEAQFAKAIQLDPRSAEPYLGLGLLYAQEGDHEKAYAAYANALEKNPRYDQVLLNRGALLFDDGRIDDAIADDRSAIAIEPLFAQAHYNLAIALLSQGKTDEALAEYEEVAAIQPTFLQARMNLGILLAKLGRLADARRQFEAILKLNPGNAAATSALEQIDRAEGKLHH
ncbi:tetratricopeptide repeat protein [Candidatus Peregrinibacteria bacterium]|nr:tetratricopeptide repeat protein [Candidatus Peregrinibacteria bacterium]MBI3815963.1 tetratricopeptide repeat protein [Candidatus Peregrinibacteria bacterium]